MPGHFWQTAVISLLSAALGAVGGAWYAGEIARDHWRLEKTVEAYDMLMHAADVGLYQAIRAKWEYRLARDAAEIHHNQKAAEEHLSRMMDASHKANEVFTRMEIGTLLLEAIGVHEEDVTRRWRKQFRENVFAIKRQSGSSDLEDSLQVGLAERRLDSLRLEIEMAALHHIEQWLED